MAIRFDYNKTTIQQFRRQLAIREKALPILKHKETALRKEVKLVNDRLEKLTQQQMVLQAKSERFERFWGEFTEILSLKELNIEHQKIIGVKVPVLRELEFQVADISWWNLPAWVPFGISLLRQVVELDIRMDICTNQLHLLHTARKKTTQKVNLYEKVQIPAYEEAILKIKRFLEDKENISKAAQKIVKRRKERRAA